MLLGQCSVHARGCIAGKVPLFNAASELEQMACIIEVLGTYDPHTWQGAARLPDFEKVRFGASGGVPLASLLPCATPAALDLVRQLFQCASGVSVRF